MVLNAAESQFLSNARNNSVRGIHVPHSGTALFRAISPHQPHSGKGTLILQDAFSRPSRTTFDLPMYLGHKGLDLNGFLTYQGPQRLNFLYGI